MAKEISAEIRGYIRKLDINLKLVRRLASVVISKITDEVNGLVKIDAQMKTRQVARCLCISTGLTYKISKKKIRVSGIAARWIPYSQLDGQKRVCVFIVRKML